MAAFQEEWDALIAAAVACRDEFDFRRRLRNTTR